jgi:hypothetical protein
MQFQLRSIAIALAIPALVLASGCCKEASGDSSTDKAATGSSPASEKADDMTDVDLAPLPLTIRVPKGGMGAMDMSLGEDKSVTVDIGDGASLNIQVLDASGLEGQKKSYKADTILHPFKRFAKESADGFVVEFESDGKTGYVGVTTQDVGGKKYVCKTTGLDGVKSVEAAEKNLAACKRLKAK